MTQQVYPVKKGQEISLVIEKLAFGGKGLARINDYVIFVPHTLPGDRIQAKIIRRKPNYAEARLLQILEESARRIEAPCPYFGWCGGCTLQNLSYQDQLHEKTAQVSESIRHLGGLRDLKINDTLPSPLIWGYRNKMEFSFSDRRWLLPEELNDQSISRDFALGLHVPGTFDKIIDIKYCMLQSEPANQVLNIVKEYCVRKDLQPYGLHSAQGFLRFLVIRQSQSSGQIMVNLVTSSKETKLFEALVQEIQEKVPEVVSVINTINRKKAQIAVGDEEIVLSGKKQSTDQIGPYVFEISASSFFQTNTRQAETLYKTILNLADLKGDEIIWDLYAGTGTISLFLAQRCKAVIAFELVESAVNDAKKNIELLLSKLNNV